MPADYAFWRDLEDQFRELIGPIRLMATWFAGPPARWSSISFNGPTDDRERERRLDLFREHSARAALAAGARPNTLEGWLNLLRKARAHFQGGSQTGWIQDLALASAEACGDRAKRSTAWKDCQAQFEKYAGQWPELQAIWKGEYASWMLRYGDKPEGIDIGNQCARVFKAVAGQAAARLSGITRDAEPWELWLDAMRASRWGFRKTGHTPCTEREWDAGVKDGKPLTAIRREQRYTTGDEWKRVYRRTKNGKLRRLSARELRGKSSNDLQKYYHWLEDGEIRQVLASSARFCEELAARGDITPKAADSATAAVPDGQETGIPEQRISPAACVPAAPKSAEQPAPAPRKRGPKPIGEQEARHVAEIVNRVALDGDWRSKVDDVGYALDHGVCNAADPDNCEATDHGKIPLPRGWKKYGHSWLSPPDRGRMVKAIKERLKKARGNFQAETPS
jgi:hypothetical protein